MKNVAKTYSLEHKEESDLFDQMLELLNLALKEKSNITSKLRRQLICCTEAIQTTLCQHLSKEEQQVNHTFLTVCFTSFLIYSQYHYVSEYRLERSSHYNLIRFCIF